MSQARLQSRPETSPVIDEILDAFSRHKQTTGRPATEVHIPRTLEARLDVYYEERHGSNARMMVPRWVGIRRVYWHAKAFRVC